MIPSKKSALRLSTPITFCDRNGQRYTLNCYRTDGLPHDVYISVIRRNFGSHGCMQTLIKQLYNEWSDKGWIVVITDDAGTVAAWGLVHLLRKFYPRSRRHKYVSDCHIYTCKKFRRQGHGSKIYKKCEQIAQQYFNKSIIVSPHDGRSRGFFVHNKVAPINWD